MSHFANFRGVNGFNGEAGAVAELSYAPDGRRFVAACVDGVSKLFESTTCRLLCTLDPRAARVSYAVWSPCGRTIALGTSSGGIVLYDALMGTELRRWNAGPMVHFIYFSPCGMRLLSGCAIEPVVRVWCPATARLICEITEENHRSVMGAFFLPGDSGDATSVISVSRAGRVSINSAVDGCLLRCFELGVGRVITMALSPSGSHIAVRVGDMTVRVFAVADATPQSRLMPGTGLTAFVWASDAVVMASRTDCCVVFFDVALDVELNRVRLPVSGRCAFAVAARPDGHQVLAGCSDGSIHILEAE